MASCVVCKDPCNDTDVKCSGGCGLIAHVQCIKGDLEGKKTRSCKEWKCKECRKSTSASSSVESGLVASGSITKDFIIKVLESFKKEIFEEFQPFKAEMEDLRKAMGFMSEKFDAANTRMEEIIKKCAGLKKENEELRATNVALNDKVSNLCERMRNMEQYSRKNNVEVSGLPPTPGEKICDLVKDVGAALGVQVANSDIAAAHRVPTYRKDRGPSLIVQFNSRAVKDIWMTKYKERKTLTAQDVHHSFPNQRIYVNDHLSPENKQFLAKLKQKCRDINYSFAWSRDGRFFARKSPGDHVHRINTYSDIDRLK